MGQVAQSLRKALFGPLAAPEELCPAIDAARLRHFERFAPMASLYAFLNALVLDFAFWPTPARWAPCIWCVITALVAIHHFRRAQATAKAKSDGRPPPPRFAGYLTSDDYVALHAFAGGALWGVVLAIMLVTGNGAGTTLVGMSAAGVMCVGSVLFAVHPRAAALYLGALALGVAVGWSIPDHMRAASAIALLGGLFLVLQRAVAMNAENFKRLRIERANFRRATDTTSLLLADFETHSTDWLWSVDGAGRLESISDRFFTETGIAREDLLGAQLTQLLDPESASAISELIREGSFSGAKVGAFVGGRQRWWSLSGRVRADGGFHGLGSDITRAVEAENRAAHSTLHDALTALPNREGLRAEIDAALATSDEDENLALLCVDLDNFKSVNDTMGHAAGDLFLKTVGARLALCAGPQAFISRMGGDEFAILIRGASRAEADDLAETVVDALLAPVVIGDREILSAGSVGVALFPEHGLDAATLMANAELALYRAKSEGRGCARFYEAGMDTAAREIAEMETDLRLALMNDSMEVYFQPLVDTRTHAISGYETLMRWNRPGHGMVSPAAFIERAEDIGVIVPLGEWVIRRAVAEAAAWNNDARVAVNLSPAQMGNPAIVSTVVAALAAAQLDPARLEIEITETIFLHDSEQNLRTLRALKEIGVRIALDDFGTGYSSLRYLQAFPFDKIKIDQCFVRDIDVQPGNRAIVRAVISLASELGMCVTAEGVETQRQADVLAELGCNEVQGYLYSRPVPSSSIEKKLAVQNQYGALTAWRARRAG